MDRRARLQQTLETEIPITTALGIRVAACDERCVVLAAPLARNINHKATAFAGSLNAALTLAGWSLLWSILDTEALPGTIVIQASTIEYLRPVAADFTARCCLPDEQQVTRFFTTLRRHRRARLELRAEIREAEQSAVVFTGRYVVGTT